MLFYVAQSDKVGTYGLSHSLLYYSHRELLLVVGAPRLSATLSCGRPAEIVMPEAEIAGLADVRLRVVKTVKPLTYGVATLIRTASGHLCATAASR